MDPKILDEVDTITQKILLTENVVNAALDNVPTLYFAKEKKCFRKKPFTKTVQNTIIFSGKKVKATDGSGTGMTVLNEQADYAILSEFKTIPTKVIIPGDVMATKDGVATIVEGVMDYCIKAQSTIMNTINGMIFGDGTGDGGRALDGLPYWVSKTPATGIVGGIDTSIITQFRNFAANALDKNSGLPNNGAPIDAGNILNIISYVINKLSSNGKSASVILVGERYYNMIDAAIRFQQRITDSNVGAAGFRTLTFNGVQIINASGLKRDTSGEYAGIGDKEMYFLSLSDFSLYYYNPYYGSEEARKLGISDEDINAIIYPESADGLILRKSENSLDYYIDLVFRGNWMLGDRQIHGVVYEEAVNSGGN